jgi:hypothetical protein
MKMEIRPEPQDGFSREEQMAHEETLSLGDEVTEPTQEDYAEMELVAEGFCAYDDGRDDGRYDDDPSPYAGDYSEM